MSVGPTGKVESAHLDSIWSTVWSGSKVVTGSLDGTIKLWEAADDSNVKLLFTSSRERSGVTGIAIPQNNTTLNTIAVCYQSSRIKLFDATSGIEKSRIEPGLLEAWSICLSPGDDVLVSGNCKGGVNIWSMQEGHEKIATLETQNKFILSTAFSVDGKLVTAGIDGIVNLIDMKTQQILHKLDAHALPIRSVAFSPEGDLVFTASDDRHVNVYDISSGTLINSFSHAGMALSIDVSPDKRHFVVGNSDHNVTLWDLGMQRCVNRFSGHHNDQVWSVSFQKDNAKGLHFLSAGDDSLMQFYDGKKEAKPSRS